MNLFNYCTGKEIKLLFHCILNNNKGNNDNCYVTTDVLLHKARVLWYEIFPPTFPLLHIIHVVTSQT